MEYLTVKDVAALVRRNEETIRRMIRARKLDVTLDNNNRRQGYMISVDQLTRTWDISREEVQQYMERQREEQQNQPPEKLPLGPERADAPQAEAHDFGKESGDAVARVLERSARLITREMNRVAAIVNGSSKAKGGEGSDMSGDYNYWINADGSKAEQGDGQSAAGQPEREAYFEYDFSKDFAAAGERVGEIIGDAYRQIRRAVDQAGAAYSANRERADAAVRDAQSAHIPYADQAISAAERARIAREQGQAAIRDAIERSGANINSNDAHHATGGWAEPMRPMNAYFNNDSDEESEACAPNDRAASQPGSEGPAYRRDIPDCGAEHEAVSAQQAPEPRPEWENAVPPTAPEFERFRGRQPDFSEAADVDTGSFANAEDNASYQLLQAARRAVEERIHAGRKSEQEQIAIPVQPVCGQAEADAPQSERDNTAAEEVESAQAAASKAVSVQEQEPVPEPAVFTLPASDEDTMQKRIDSLEAQLSKLSGQLEQLTRRLLGDDK